MSWQRQFLALLALLTLVGGNVAAASAPEPEPIDLNYATMQQLQALPGIGQKRALAIIERRARRPFRRASDLLRIRGIGLRMYKKLRPLVRVALPAKEAREVSN